MVKRIAVGQSGGPTAVINDTLAGVIYESQLRGIEVVGLQNGLEGGGLHPEISGNLKNLSGSGIDSFFLRGIPGAALGTTRLKLEPGKDDEKIERLSKNLHSYKIDALLYIGGNDSALTLSAMNNGIHLSKTEDNDLERNDHTPGWGSACLSNCEIIRALTPDVSGFKPLVRKGNKELYSSAPVVVYQAQGRDSGWLTLGCAFAKINHAGDVIENASPHLFLIRERAFDKKTLLDKVDNLLRKQGFAFVVCGEELVDERGKPLSEVYKIKERKDEFGHIEHSRAGAFNYANFVASLVRENLGVETDSHVGVEPNYSGIKETPLSPQHIQRSLCRSLIDAQEAFEIGRRAVKSFDKGHFNISIALQRFGDSYNIKTVELFLNDVAGKVRAVDKKYLGDIQGPSSQFYKDFLQLVGGPLGMTHYVVPVFPNLDDCSL